MGCIWQMQMKSMGNLRNGEQSDVTVCVSIGIQSDPQKLLEAIAISINSKP